MVTVIKAEKILNPSLMKILRGFIDTGWASIEMMGESDGTARQQLRHVGMLMGEKVHTFRGGHFNATMFGHFRNGDWCAVNLSNGLLCALPMQPYVNTNGTWKDPCLPLPLRP